MSFTIHLVWYQINTSGLHAINRWSSGASKARECVIRIGSIRLKNRTALFDIKQRQLLKQVLQKFPLRLRILKGLNLQASFKVAESRPGSRPLKMKWNKELTNSQVNNRNFYNVITSIRMWKYTSVWGCCRIYQRLSSHSSLVKCVPCCLTKSIFTDLSPSKWRHDDNFLHTYEDDGAISPTIKMSLNMFADLSSSVHAPLNYLCAGSCKTNSLPL